MREDMVAAYNRGWQLIPLKHNSKHPNLPIGHKFLTEKASKDDYKSFNFNNYGVVCGKLSGITVIDVDFPEGTDVLDELGIELEAIETPQVFTPNGRHLFFKYNSESRTGVAVMGKGVDVRNDGSYVVGAGSVVEGEVYSWHEIYGPDVALAEVPDWLDYNRKANGGAEWKMHKKLGKGERNVKMFSLARSLVNRELPAPLVFECLLMINDKWCERPLEREEVEKIVQSAESYGSQEESK